MDKISDSTEVEYDDDFEEEQTTQIEQTTTAREVLDNSAEPTLRAPSGRLSGINFV